MKLTERRRSKLQRRRSKLQRRRWKLQRQCPWQQPKQPVLYFRFRGFIKGQSFTALDSQQTRLLIRHPGYPYALRYSGSQLRRLYQNESQYIQKLKSLSVIKRSKEMQDQGLSGYSAAPLTPSAPLRLGATLQLCTHTDLSSNPILKC